MEPDFAPPVLGGADAAFVVAALALLLGAGTAIAGRPRDALGFLLAGRRAPFWAAGLSLTAAELSGITLLALPAAAYGRDLTFLQFLLGAALGRAAVAFWLVPAVHRSGCLTIYELLRPRLGPLAERSAAVLFLLARLAGAAARLAVASAALSTLLDWPPGTAAAVLALAAAAYLGFGGAAAAVWAGAVQALLILAAAAALLWHLVAGAHGGAWELWQAAAQAGRLRALDLSPAPGASLSWALATEASLFWPACLSGLMASLAGFAADHELMQRALCTRRPKDATRAVLVGLAGSLAAALLLMACGTALFATYELHPGLSRPPSPDQALPHLAATLLGPGLRGLLLAALAAAAVDLPLASAGAVFLANLAPGRPGASPERDLRVARLAAGGAAALALAGAALCADPGLAGWAYHAGSIAAGPLLGAFLLAASPGRADDAAAAAGLWLAAALNAAVFQAAQSYGAVPASGWLAVLGALAAAGFGRFARLYRSG